MARLRLFVAVEVDEEVRKNLAEFQALLKEAGSDVRWVDVQNIHITLKFLGYVEEVNLPRVKEIIKKAVTGVGPFGVRFEGVGAFPRLERPRVVFVAMEDPAEGLSKINSQLEEGFVELGIEKEGRDYEPHLTIGRVKSSRNLEPLVKLLRHYTKQAFGQERVSRVVLMQSELSPEGPTYTELDSFTLS